MNQSFQWSSRTAVKELILWVGTITIITLILTGVFFYHYTTSAKLHSLKEQAQQTADEIAEVLTIPLYNLDDETAVNSAQVYLSSGRLFGIQLVSSATGVLSDTFRQSESLIPPIQRNISYNGMILGSVTLLFADTEIRSAQKDTLMIITFLTCGIVAVYAFTLQFIFSRVLIGPLARIIEGIRRFGSNDFEYRISNVKYQDLNQLVLGLNNMAQNIDSSRRELLESQMKYSSILNSSFVAILLCGTNGRILDANDTATDMFKAKNKQALLEIGNIHGLMVSEHYGKGFEEVWNRLARTEEPGSSQSWRAHHLGTTNTFHVDIAVKPMRLSESDFLVINMLDITDRKVAEENLVQVQKMEALGVLAGGLAHDFNNVLSGITGYVYLLKLKLENQSLDDANLMTSLEKIEHASFRASGVINQLLTASKKHSTQLSIININELVSNVLTIGEKSFDKSIDVQVNYHDNDAWALADPVQIEQVLLNLCVNATHAMTIMRDAGESWGGQLIINVTELLVDHSFKKLHPQAFEDNYWCIEVRDTGVGMAKQELSNIFVPFYSTKNSSQGTGLGLAMVFNIIREHNGFIDVHSEKDIGSSLSIFLPKYTDTVQDASSIPAVSDFAGDGVILLIDDDDTVRSTTKSLLNAFGFEVLTAANGAEGLTIYRERYKTIDLVILDMVMPKLSGKETYHALRTIRSDIRTILISGFGKDDRVQELLDMGVDTFLQKPFTVSKLIRAISATTGQAMP